MIKLKKAPEKHSNSCEGCFIHEKRYEIQSLAEEDIEWHRLKWEKKCHEIKEKVNCPGNKTILVKV